MAVSHYRIVFLLKSTPGSKVVQQTQLLTRQLPLRTLPLGWINDSGHLFFVAINLKLLFRCEAFSVLNKRYEVFGRKGQR